MEQSTPARVAIAEGFPRIYHLLHMANLRSVMERGLLSRQAVQAEGVPLSSLQSQPVQAARSAPLTLPDGSVWPLDHYLTFRWFPSTPVLANLAYDWREGRYSLEAQEFLVLLEVDVAALDQVTELWFATAHPFNRECSLVARDDFGAIPWERLRAVRSHHGDFSDPISHSELLVGDVVPPAFLRGAAVCDERAAERVRALGVDLPVTVREEWFFGTSQKE